jgi:hypothetical protein
MRVLRGIKESWYLLPNWQRHAGGSAVLVMIFTGIQQMIHSPLNWALSAVISLSLGVIKELLEEENTWTEALKDIVWNILGVVFVVLCVFVLGNDLVPNASAVSYPPLW